MKRVLALIFALCMLLSCVACSSSISEETGTEETKTAAEEAKTESAKDKTQNSNNNDKIVYPEGFSAGYARADITPQDPLPIYDATASTTNDPLYVSCTAVCDGEQAALMMTVDLKGISKSLADKTIEMIGKKFGIGRDYIIMSATHTHSAHTGGTDGNDNMVRWTVLWYKQVELAVRQALSDLAPAEAYTGLKQTEDIAFVRRYKLASGKYQTNPSASDKPVEHESEADNELRTIRFERGDKKDILLMNFQTHYGLYVEAYSADFVGHLRQWAEKEMDVHFAYYSGASGNLNMTNRVGASPDKMDSVKKMWTVCKEAVAGEEKVNTGKVCGASNQFAARVGQDSEEDIRIAKEINGTSDEKRKSELMAKYKISSSRWVQGVITRSGLGETQKIPFHAISFGDIAFSTSPIEQFDANAKQVREGSPFKMTFTCSLTNGSFGYVPTKEAFPHGGYEVLVCRYAQGSGEEFAQEQIRLLNVCKDAA